MAATQSQHTQSVPSAQPYNVPKLHDDEFRELLARILSGQADLRQVRIALTASNPLILSNILHALYNMHWQRGVYYLLNGMWLEKKSEYPELSWELLSAPPARIALACTLNRMYKNETDEYINYIRQYKDNSDPVILAQVAAGLGYNADPADISYIEELAKGNNPNLSKTALISLSLMKSEASRVKLKELLELYSEDPRGDLIRDLLEQKPVSGNTS